MDSWFFLPFFPSLVVIILIKAKNERHVYSSFHFLYTLVSLPHWDTLATKKTLQKVAPAEKVPLKSVPAGNNPVPIENCCDLTIPTGTLSKFEGKILFSPLEFYLNFSFPQEIFQTFCFPVEIKNFLNPRWNLTMPVRHWDRDVFIRTSELGPKFRKPSRDSVK